jgi:hypothetical protein
VDKNNCGSNQGKPFDEQVCIIEGDCEDIDGDGYGEGIDCLGIDLDDNDPAINAISREEPSIRINIERSFIIYLMIGFVIVLILIGIILLVYLKKRFIRGVFKSKSVKLKSIKSNAIKPKLTKSKSVKPKLTKSEVIRLNKRKELIINAKKIVKEARRRKMSEEQIIKLFKEKNWKKADLDKIM